MTDIHLHTSISHDSDEPIENFIMAAVKRGDGALGFSEHYDYDVYLAGDEIKLPDLKRYSEQISSARRKFPQMKILQGLELGYFKDAVPHYRELIKSLPLDHVILSVHTLPDRGDCYYPKFYEGLTRKEAYSKYLEAVLESVNSDIDFDVVGHIAYVARYAPYADKMLGYADFPDLFDEILKTIIARGKCLEINTSAKGTGGAFVPGADVVERYVELGGRDISFGSDAHTAARYKDGEGAVLSLLNSLGITRTCHFEGRKKVFS